MGYITVALPPEVRQAPGYNPKSGAADWAQVRVNASGKVVVTMGTAPQGQGHETAVAQIVADELGLTPDDVATVDEFDSHTSVWSVSSGSYSSRFSGIAAGAARRSAGVVRRQILEIGATLLEANADDLELADGAGAREGQSPDRAVSLRRVAGVAHWDPHGLPEGMSAGIQASEVFHIPSSAPPTDDDRVNSSHAYGFIADVIAVEVDPVTWQVRILKYASAHDAGTIINPKLVEGQVYGAALHGLGGALLEEYRWDEDGQFLTGTFADYRVLTAAEAPRIEMAEIETPSPFTPVGSKGCGESASESAPAAVANAVADALRPLGRKPTPPAADAGPTLGADAVKPAPFAYHRPATLDEALAILAADEDAKPLAGGQSLVPMLNFRLARPSALVDLSELEARRDPPGGRRARRRRDDPPVGPRAPRRCLPAPARRPRARRTHGDALPRDGRRVARPRRPDRRAAGVRAGARGGARARTAGRSRPRSSSSRCSRPRWSPASCSSRSGSPQPQGETSFGEVAHRDGDFAVVCVARNGDRVAVGGVARDAGALGRRRARARSATSSRPAGYKRAIAERLVAP